MLKKCIAATVVSIGQDGSMVIENEINGARIRTTLANHCRVEFGQGVSTWMLVFETRHTAPALSTRLYAELSDKQSDGAVGWVAVQEFDTAWYTHKRNAQAAGVILSDPQRPEELYGIKRQAAIKKGALQTTFSASQLVAA